MYTVTFEHSNIVYTTFDHEDAIAFAVNQAMLLHDAYYIIHKVHCRQNRTTDVTHRLCDRPWLPTDCS